MDGLGGSRRQHGSSCGVVVGVGGGGGGASGPGPRRRRMGVPPSSLGSGTFFLGVWSGICDWREALYLPSLHETPPSLLPQAL